MKETGGTSFVYAIGQASGPQKVGFSMSPQVRAKTLGTAKRPLMVNAQVSVLSSAAREVEKIAHWLLRGSALGYERFDVSPQEASAAILEAVERYDAGQRMSDLAPELETRTMQMVVYPKWEAIVDEWRRAQPDNPNKSEAIRRMVLLAAGVTDPRRWLEDEKAEREAKTPLTP